MISKRTNEEPAVGTACLPFDFVPTTRVVFGIGKLGLVGELARELAANRILVVTDPGLEEAGHVSRAVRLLEAARLTVSVFDGVEENPTTRHVEACAAAARAFRAEALLGLGGGSAMDTAKGANFLVTNGGQMSDYQGIGKATRPMLPFLAVPTTAGTGSEAQSFALVAKEDTHEKMACGDRKAAARIALLDPQITLSQPPHVTANCGIDALAHAIESFVTAARNPISSLFAREAWRLLSRGFPQVIADPVDLDARGRMLLGAHFAGCAIEASMLGATHSAANPLTAHHGIVHGTAIALLLAPVIRFNGREVAALYAELIGGPSATAADRLADQVRAWCRHAGLPMSLAALSVPRGDIPRLAEEAARQWTARFNPRTIGAADFARLYEAAFDP